MPQAINGCGTWYYGKKNVNEYQGTCRNCGNHATLKSYDTRLYVIFIFVPIIPLGRKRIIEECGACQRHFVVPLDDYRRGTERIQKTLDDFRKSPQDFEAAKEVLAATVGMRNMQGFLNVAPELEKGMSQNAKGLCMLAASHEVFARWPDAERLYRAALEVENEDEISELLAVTLMQQGKPEEAESYLEHIVEQSIPDRVDYLFRLAQVYQSKGNHEKAVEIFNQCEAIVPAVAHDEVFQKLRTSSEGLRGSNRVIGLGEVSRKLNSSKQRRRFSKVAGFVVTLAGALYVVWAIVLGYQREVFVVNGLNTPYAVDINGTRYSLPPMGMQKVRTGEGKLTIQMLDTVVPVSPQTVEVRTSFISRPFSKAVFVVNPDETAIIRQATIYYARNANDAPPPTEKFSAGQVLIRLDGVDNPFEAPPESVSMKSSSGTVSRVTAAQFNPAQVGISPATALMALSDELPAGAPKEMVRRHVLLEPDQAEFMGLLSRFHNPEEIVAIVRPLLGVRPLRMQWHRLYQDALSELGRDNEAEQEYTAMLQKEPQNKDLMYLLGRATNDVDKAVALCRQAVQTEPASAFALYYLAGFSMQEAQFPEAIEFGQRMVSAMPSQIEFRRLYAQALVAGKQFPKALELLRADARLPWPESAFALTEQLYVYGQMGQPGDAELVLNQFARQLKLEGLQASNFKATHKAYAAYATGDLRQFDRALSVSTDPDDRLLAALSRGDTTAIDKELPTAEKSAETLLLCYLSAKMGGVNEAADRHLQEAIKLLGSGSHEDRAYAAALGGSPTMPAAQLVKLWRGYTVKRIYMAAMALRDTSNRAVYVPLGAKLNFDRRFPHQLIDRALVQATGEGR